MTLDRMRVAEITGILSHVAGILDALPLDAYRDTLAGVDEVSVDEPAGNQHRRARRAALRDASQAARDLVSATQDALTHNRAAWNADQLEQEQHRPERPYDVIAFTETHAAAVRQAHPGATVITMPRREEAIPGDDPEAG